MLNVETNVFYWKLGRTTYQGGPGCMTLSILQSRGLLIAGRWIENESRLR